MYPWLLRPLRWSLAQQIFGKQNFGIPAVGQCRLTKSGSNLLLSQEGGNLLTINGRQCVVPDAGVTLAPTSLTPGTTYYIYATESAGTVNALEASTTVPVFSTTAGNKGVKIKTGDDARTLVGQAAIITGPAWVDTDAQRYVISYFNRKNKGGKNVYTASRPLTATSFAEPTGGSEIRVGFLTWADEAVTARFVLTGNIGSTANALWSAIAFDGTTAEDGGTALQGSSGAGNINWTASGGIEKSGLSEGLHYATLVGMVSAGTFNFDGNAVPGTRCTVTVNIRG